MVAKLRRWKTNDLREIAATQHRREIDEIAEIWERWGCWSMAYSIMNRWGYGSKFHGGVIELSRSQVACTMRRNQMHTGFFFRRAVKHYCVTGMCCR